MMAFVPRWPVVGGAAAAAAGGGLILLACCLFPLDLPLQLLFVPCLVVLVASAAVLFRRERWRVALLAVLAATGLLLLSLLPVFSEHWAPKSLGTHRHTLWELGHVH